jgi:GNAT superfamily N-acetyltransferase
MRVLPEGVGLASIDDTTPQLGIALEPRYQRRGLGEPLMREALARAWQAGHEKVSLTVHPENPAIPLYIRQGRDSRRISPDGRDPAVASSCCAAPESGPTA